MNVLKNLRDGIPYPYTEDDAKDYITAMLFSDVKDTFAFAVEYEGKAVGSISAFRQGNIHGKTAELGYYIGEEYWGKGIATEAVTQLVDDLFENTDIVRIFAEPFANNIASCRVLEKAGFQCEGTQRKNAEKCGQALDMKMYSIVR